MDRRSLSVWSGEPVSTYRKDMLLYGKFTNHMSLTTCHFISLSVFLSLSLSLSPPVAYLTSINQIHHQLPPANNHHRDHNVHTRPQKTYARFQEVIPASLLPFSLALCVRVCDKTKDSRKILQACVPVDSHCLTSRSLAPLRSTTNARMSHWLDYSCHLTYHPPYPPAIYFSPTTTRWSQWGAVQRQHYGRLSRAACPVAHPSPSPPPSLSRRADLERSHLWVGFFCGSRLRTWLTPICRPAETPFEDGTHHRHRFSFRCT